MSTLKFYLGLIKLIDKSENELNLADLTPSDKLVLIALWDKADKETGNVNLTFELFSELNDSTTEVSRSQFFKSVNKLLGKKVITKEGSPRSSNYKFSNIS